MKGVRHYNCVSMARSSMMAIVAATSFGTAALAQEAPASPAAADDGKADIVVTGSRIARSGFSTPTPTTVLNADLLEKQGQVNVADFLNQIPAVRASTTSATGTFGFRAGAGGNFVNLRGLGTNRTLVLVDGQRVVPTTTTGLVDLNIVPSVLIDRTEVVTGGASAAYGSDAVSGVVNLILKKKFEGVQVEGQSGVSQHGDDQSYRAAIIAGTHFGEGGQILVAADYAENKGIAGIQQRDWTAQAGGVIVGANNVRYLVNDLQFNNQTYGSIINAGPLKGTAFTLNGGTPYAFQYGNTFGNAASTVQQGGGNPQSFNYDAEDTKIPFKRYTAFAKASYEFSPAFELTATVNYAHSGASRPTLYARDAALSIRNDNAFLPDSVKAQMASANVATVTVGRINRDLGAFIFSDDNNTLRGSIAASGDLGSTIKYQVYAATGRNKISYDYTARIDGAMPGDPAGTKRFLNAIDAVKNGQGQIVCRVNLVTVTSPGCVPFNIFGEQTLTAAQRAWLVGTQHVDQVTRQTAAGVNVQATPFSTWAGPVSVAVGGEYRRDSQNVTVDGGSLARAFNLGNTQPITGAVSVYEGYAEVLLPLLRDLPLFKSLDVDGAVRRTHYSLSGNVTTWKAGLNWAVNDSLRLRATRSRDIRAPNLSELFQPLTTSQGQVLIKNAQGVAVSTLVNTRSTGNPLLKPEIADTLSFGAVLTPTFIPGLRASVDYYDIKLKGAISTVANQALINGCEQQNLASYCARINKNTADGIPLLDLSPANLNSIRTTGIDFELAYGFPVGPGRLDLSTQATYVIHMTTTDALGTFDRAGEITNGLFSPGQDTPRWTGNLNLNYGLKDVNLLANVRYVGGALIDKFAAPGQIVGDNNVSPRAYLNLSFQWDFAESGRRKLQLFGGIDNVMNASPPAELVLQLFNAGSTASYYDVSGRRFRMGARVKF